MKPGTTLLCTSSGRLFTVVPKRKPKNGYAGGVKMIHLKADNVEQSVREDLLMEYFEVVK